MIAIGQTAPDFALLDLAGALHRLSDQRGRVVVINFWSAECPHSRRADRLLDELRPEWGQRVVVWSIAPNANELPDRLIQAGAKRGVRPLLRDEEQRAVDLLGAVTTPHFFVIDPQGVLRYSGAPDDVDFRRPEPTRTYLPAAVAAALEGRSPEPAHTQAFGCAIVRRGL